MITFGQFIKLKRETLGVSQQTLTDACGLNHRSEISRLEAGKFEWKLNQVVAIAGVFGTTASKLLAEWESIESTQNSEKLASVNIKPC